MSKVSPRRIGKKRQEYWEAFLRQYFLRIRDEKDFLKFLDDVLTASEKVMLARRISVAQLLMTGMSFQEVCDELYVGQQTVERVDRWLKET